MENWRRGDDLQPLLVRLAEYCYKAGIPEEEVVRQTIIHYYAQAEEQTVRTMVHNIYQESKGFGSKTIFDSGAGYRSASGRVYGTAL